MVNLNSLIVRASDINVQQPMFINDRGEIGGFGILPNGDFRAVLLFLATGIKAQVILTRATVRHSPGMRLPEPSTTQRPRPSRSAARFRPNWSGRPFTTCALNRVGIIPQRRSRSNRLKSPVLPRPSYTDCLPAQGGTGTDDSLHAASIRRLSLRGSSGNLCGRSAGP